MRILMAMLWLVGTACGQFELQTSGTTASLRGVSSAGVGVAWASGSDGTVIRTEDAGGQWQRCAVPKGAEKLDFRGVVAVDAKTAVVMASGKGDASRIYRTTDGCQTWKMVFADPDANGFFDAVVRVTERQMYLLGDPVDGKFAMFFSPDQGVTWYVADDPGLDAGKGDGAFAASNSAMTKLGVTLYFGAGGTGTPQVYATYPKCAEGAAKDAPCPLAWRRAEVPMAAGSAGAGVFSLAARAAAGASGKVTALLVAVGGDYEKADATAGTAAFSRDGGQHWTAAEALPGGYRSAVVFDAPAQAWVTVGPNGADVSRDDGKTWTPLLGSTASGWNAISLPFVVGPRGRIGRLLEGALAK